jgi:hypothetical protein
MADDHGRDNERTKRSQHERAATRHERAARDREAADAAELFGEAGTAEDHRDDARRHEAAADDERRRAD